MRFALPIFCVIFYSCLSTKNMPEVSGEIVAVPSVEIYHGDSRHVIVQNFKDESSGKLYCDDKIVPYACNGQNLEFYISADYFSKLRMYKCYFKNDPSNPILNVSIVAKDYPLEKFNVDERRITLSAADQERVEREKRSINKIITSSDSSKVYRDKFVRPLNSKITSPYGIRRIFNQKKKTQHIGVDFRAPIGRLIPVANDGKVVFTGELFYSGNVVIVNHGLGVFTTYAHLSKIKVKRGDSLTQGDIVGEAGMTGRVNGPHLHWGAMVSGHWINGLSLLQTPLIISYLNK